MVAIADAAQRGEIQASIAIVVSNNPSAAAIEHARGRKLTVHIVDRRDGRPRAERHDDVTSVLKQHDVDLVVCAGFDEILSAAVTSAYSGRILNIHPSLL